VSYCSFIGDIPYQASPAERADILLPPDKHRKGVDMATPHSQPGRVVRISADGENGGDVIHELYAVAIDDDQGALDAFHEQFAVYGSATHIVGPLSAATLELLTLAQGQAAPL
jgi:hypothetical protein